MNTNKTVETAINNQGDSYIVRTSEQSGWSLQGHTISELFSAVEAPSMLDCTPTLSNTDFNLKPGEVRFIRSDIEPTKSIYHSMSSADKQASLDSLFYHSTSTIDYFVVTQGTLTLIVGDERCELRAGDAIVQRGAAHAWHNYSTEIASIMGVMTGVSVPPQFKRVDTVQPSESYEMNIDNI